MSSGSAAISPFSAGEPSSCETPRSDTPMSDLSAASSSTSIASRTRYLFPKIDTVESLRPEEVRWFYKEAGDKKWTPFIGYDSLRLECKFREVLHRRGNKTDAVVDDHDNELINVRGGIYEVDVAKRKCLPVYWSAKGRNSFFCFQSIGSCHQELIQFTNLQTAQPSTGQFLLTEQSAFVLRGTWFVDGTWQPLDENHANQIETEHLAKFENQKIPEDEPEAATSSRGLLPGL